MTDKKTEEEEEEDLRKNMGITSSRRRQCGDGGLKKRVLLDPVVAILAKAG